MTLKEFRVSKNLSQEKFAQTLGYTLSLYSKVERGANEPSRKFMKRVKEVYPDIDINAVFFVNQQQ